MERKVVWSPQSLEDLEGTRDYIARDSERYAISLVDDMIEASHTLNTLSERGRMVPEFNEMSIREIFIKHHRLIYEVSKNRVEVLAVIHMSRDFNKAWNDRES